ncbi:MAG TPA: acetate--CoA ligase family protein [Candidatus Saccharimonadaceae bacterium]|jgi:acetyltransferase|nr:acetate--CoA ligase family protein [Candidatus Saccharimonadaceae bacterium]
MNAPSSAVPVAAPNATAAAPTERPGLEAVFRPRSIAVIGASRERGTVGAEIFHNLLEHGFQGVVYPVNPKADSVQSVKAFPTIEHLPEAVDLAIVVVPAAHVEGVMEACGRKGVKAAVVISAGFKETGGEGVERERRLVAIARRYGMRLVGPNCLGVLNTENGVRMDATFAPTYPPAGSVAFSSQSGALGLAILEAAADLNIGISQFISVGNKADVSGNDLLEFWERDPATRVILLYLESFGNAHRFLEIARRVARKKPIVAVKSGRTRAGMRAASSHTGSLAGADTAVSALCTQAGVIRTDTMEELFDVAMLLANQPVPLGPRVGIVTNAGGPGIMASDACESHGLEVVTLSDETTAALKAFLPAEASTKNPVDMIASATPQSFEKAVRLVANDPNVDALLVLYVPPIVTRPLDVAQAIVRGNEEAKADAEARGGPAKPVLACFMGSHGVPEGLQSLQVGHIPSYAFPESAAIALVRAVEHGRWLAAPEGAVRTFADVDAAAASRVLATARARARDGQSVWLEPGETRALLEAYRIRTPEIVTATDAGQAVAAANRIGYPVVVKLASTTLTHKSDVGGVVLDVRDADDVRRAVAGIASRLDAIGKRAEMQGVTVQPMIKDGIESIIGVTRDPAFGPLIMFGLGGVQVELLKDVVFRIHPLTDRDAREMVHGLRASARFAGYRGAPPGDVAALEETLLRVSQMAGAHPEIAELDLNPLVVFEPGKGCLGLDARVAVAGEPK